MKLFLIINLCIASITSSLGCCGAGQYKTYPLGYQNSRLVVAEFTMSRHCEDNGASGVQGEFHWVAKVNLCYISADTTIMIKSIDTLSFKECVCSYNDVDIKSQISTMLLPSYERCLVEAKKMKGFQVVTPVSYHSTNDNNTLNDFRFVNTDTTSLLYYRGKLKDLRPVNWAACGFLNNVVELRKYKFQEKEIVIINVNCRPGIILPEEKLASNKRNFKSIESAVTYTPTQWHGLSRDYLIEY